MHQKNLKIKCLFMVLMMIFSQVVIMSPEVFADTVNLAQGKSITASNYTQTYVATNSNDGNVNSYWEGAANSYPNTLTVDLGSTQAVNKVVLKLNPATVWATRTQTFSILGSTDNISFSTITAATTYTFNPNTSNTVTINFTNTSIRYLRLNFTANSGSSGAQVAEFEVYGGTTTLQPDLSVTALTFAPANPTAGQTITLTATVKNLGTTATTAGVINVVGFNIGSTKVTGSTTSSIAAGGTATVTANWTSVGGTYTVSANADDTNVIAESSETNNSFTSITQLLISGGGSTTKYEGESATLSGGAKINTDHSGYTGTGFVDGIQTSGSSQALFTVNVSTAGYYDVTLRYADAMGSDRTMSIYVNGNDVKQTVLPNLATWDAWGNKIETLNLNAGNNTIAYKYDTEDNGNINLDFITVGPTTVQKSDLVVTDITWTPASPIEGTAVNFSAVVKNNGTAAGAAGILVFQVDGTQVTASLNNTTSIAVGGTATISGGSSWTSVLGNHTIKAIVDNSNTTAEINETNNNFSKVAALVVTPVSSSDLVPASVSWTPGNPSAGNTVPFTVSIKNQGTITSASGAHGITLILTDAITNAVIKTLTGSYNGVIAAGTTTSPISMGSFTAINGKYNIKVQLAVDSNEILIKQSNNITTQSFFVGRGANMPYDMYEAEDGTIGGGASIVGPNRIIGDLAGEASGRKAVTLNSTGSYVQFTTKASTNTLVTRFSIPDGTGGDGKTATLNVYINGVFNQTITLTSKYSWLYGSETLPSNGPSAGAARHIYDEANIMFNSSIPAGSTIKLQKDAANDSQYAIDFISLEQVTPIANPDPTKYVTPAGFTQQDIQNAINTANQNSAMVGVYLPAGNYLVSYKIQVGSKPLKIVGAGPWYTRLSTDQNQSGTDAGFSTSAAANGSTFSNFSFFGNYTIRNDGPGKVFDFSNVSGDTIDNLWIEHTVCMYWGLNTDNMVITNCRIRNTFADGINMTNGSCGNLVSNCEARATGDDSFALFSAIDGGGSDEINNTFQNLTTILTWRAAGIAVYGGYANTFKNIYIADTLCYSGVTISSLDFGYAMNGFGASPTTNLDNISLVRCGGHFWGTQVFPAIWVFSASKIFQGIRVSNVDIVDPTYSGIMFQTNYSGGVAQNPVKDTVFNNITISGAQKSGDAFDAKSGIGIWANEAPEAGQGPAVGSATFNNLSIISTVTPIKNTTTTFAITVNP
ncbi:MAG: discoidin domain-containing protein [Clostridiaceae bacterium]|nr:discoidin domain-containing protein [Clostridiaceae bacterium]